PKNLSWLADAMAVIASETFTSVSAPIQYAAVTAFQGSPAIDQYVRHSRLILAAVGQYIYDRLSAIGITMPRPQGGFYLFPNFHNHRDFLKKKNIDGSVALCEVMLEETGVALLPGVAFGRPPGELTARLSYVDFDGAAFLSFLSHEKTSPNLTEGIKKFGPKMIEGSDKLENWLTH
ncbi:MAG: aminotransferase class I/II-fold pyridoxal phosphate-dependent enzyme, partial [Bacteroidetes bacterium]